MVGNLVKLEQSNKPEIVPSVTEIAVAAD